MASTIIFGAGFLGRRLARDLPDAVLSTADITDGPAVLAAIRQTHADAVVNAAGKTGRPNVDWCESHQPETYRVNVIGALTVADACAEAGAYLLHLGSGCIFYGPSPSPGGWLESDYANPAAFYSRTKYAADLVLSRLPNVGVARLRMPIDSAPHERNLITKLARYSQVIDVENSVTVVDDFVQAVARLLQARADGIFHVVNPGVMRHRDLLGLYRDMVDPTHVCSLIPEDELITRRLAVKVRSNCLLASPRLTELGIELRPIGAALADTMRQYAAALRR